MAETSNFMRAEGYRLSAKHLQYLTDQGEDIRDYIGNDVLADVILEGSTDRFRGDFTKGFRAALRDMVLRQYGSLPQNTQPVMRRRMSPATGRKKRR